MNNMANILFVIASNADNLEEKTRILGFDKQLLFQTAWHILAVLVLFFVLAKLLFNPIRKLLKDRAQTIKNEYNTIDENMNEAKALRAEYDSKMKEIKAEHDRIISEAHSKAVKREEVIVKEANEEAKKIMGRAHLEIQREREGMQDSIKVQIVEVARDMAAKLVKVSMTKEEQQVLINKTIDEMGEDVWSN